MIRGRKSHSKPDRGNVEDKIRLEEGSRKGEHKNHVTRDRMSIIQPRTAMEPNTISEENKTRLEEDNEESNNRNHGTKDQITTLSIPQPMTGLGGRKPASERDTRRLLKRKHLKGTK